MKIFLILIISTILFGESIYEITVSPTNKQAIQNKKVKCVVVCNKRVYREQQISAAVSFYKKSKNYHFNRNGFESFK